VSHFGRAGRRLTARRALARHAACRRSSPDASSFTQPERLSPAWTLTKGTKTAVCEVWSHVFGFELRALIGPELVQSHVCRSQEDMIRVQDEWRAAFEAKGWRREADQEAVEGQPAG
jgi:hypothetical protein